MQQHHLVISEVHTFCSVFRILFRGIESEYVLYILCLGYHSGAAVSVFILFILCLGYYSGAGASSCDICPAGSYCNLTEATLCEPGSYSLDGFTSCTSCVPGQCQMYCERILIFLVLHLFCIISSIDFNRLPLVGTWLLSIQLF